MRSGRFLTASPWPSSRKGSLPTFHPFARDAWLTVECEPARDSNKEN
jgi:hypothetical protein